MPRAWSSRQGSLLLEAVVSIGVFAVFLGGIGLTLVLGERSTVAGGDRVLATFVAEQALEGTRKMAAKNFTSVTTGFHGVKLINKVWTFTGTLITTPNGYRSSVEVVNMGTDWLEVRSRASWNFGQSRSGSIVLTSYLTNWRKKLTIGNWGAMTRIANVTATGTPDYQKIVIAGNYAYITSLHASGMRGLYIYNISNPAAPVRVASTFDLGVAAYGIAVDGARLYLATNSTTEELQVYDITDPPNLTTANLLKSYDLPGNGRARSVTSYGDTIFVGAIETPPEAQFYALQWSESNPIVQLGSLSVSGGVMGIGLREGYAYIATTYNTGELQVIDVFDPENLAFAPGTGIDMTDVFDGSAIATFGTSALIGRLNGSTIEEVVLYPVTDSPVPVTPPGPWTLEVGGNALSLTNVYGGKYAFLGSDASSAQLRVLDVNRFSTGLAPIVNTFNASAAMRGLFYDWRTDRLFGVTPNGLMVFAPG